MELYTIDDFFTKEDLEFYKTFVKKIPGKRSIISDIDVCQKLWEKYKDKILNFTIKDHGISDRITCAKEIKPIVKHVDRIYDSERYKLLVYLNKIENGGTIFYIPDKVEIDNKENRAVVFDMAVPHESQIFKSGIKHTIGFRIN